MKKKCVAMLLAGGQGSRLYALTQNVAKPSMPFGGKYRIIDFPLSNCANSGIDTVGVLTQYQPLQLNSYIGNGSAWDLGSSDGGVYILPPYQTSGEKGVWFKGTANAIYQNISFLDLYTPEYVLILSGDHIYKMDYSKMLDEHIKNEADCTIAVIQVPMEEASRFGIMSLGEDGSISKFTEKPKEPDSDLASMGIYIFTWDKLRRYLIEDEADPGSENDFGKNIIPKMLAAGERMWPYRFEGYWRDVGTISSFWDANMDMLDPTHIDLYDMTWPIMANGARLQPQYIGDGAQVSHSIVTGGCIVKGSVSSSVLSRSVQVEDGAVVKYSIIMPGAVIERGAVVEYAIIGENTRVCAGCHIGSEPSGEEGWGIATCGPNIKVAPGAVVPAGAMIYSDVEVEK
ncbi:MAG: glucose-1-phosphate adenylyltransferase [Butyricicoccus sp.]|nr:glucose-1-phosphate adenylyltransferase [Butyricicoccus sp.]